ncbi:hypothetical protein [Caulobacter segnis]|uniref:Uncharacterized protein n=1 Tax=Caulobacter segnis TaxID=88688 RepID=A0A2W5XDY5_9CAUL|nr:hypothetical protein [Caulobacter segnis]PZR35791.1 MAG: hypothetical protein DI526_05750 [Caulobacter segnis]
MPIFRVNIDREVTNWDRFVRYVEADTAEEAERLGAQLATAADDTAPDDAGPGNFDDELGDWHVNSVEPVDFDASEIDVVMSADDVAATVAASSYGDAL